MTHPIPSRRRGAVVGLAAAAVALGVAELVAGLSAPLRSPIFDVGDRVIDLVPPSVKDFAIAVFGTNDKVALLIGIGVLLAAYAAGVGVLAVRRGWMWGVAGVGLFGVVGATSAFAGTGGPIGVLPSVAGALTGATALYWLAASTTEPRSPHFEASRRQFLFASGAAFAGAALLGATGRLLDRRFDVAPSLSAVSLPDAARPLGPLPAGSAFDIRGLDSFVTPNVDFYRIDTALTVPRIPIDSYQLSITGMVDRPLVLSYADLLDREVVEADITMTCVSNEVGGQLVGNARWLGVPLAPLLAEAGIRAGADQIVGRSVDDYTCGFPVSALDGRQALIAVGMNGEPLPPEHGFPARLIVAGLYGYVSATKWLREIELTTFDAFDHYWVRRGWSAQAPIKTQSRIDTPGPLARIPAGTTPIAGVAWAQTRGISKVEVRVDDGEWREATLAGEVNDSTWRQWMLPWDAAPGTHTLTVRATDGAGETQTEERVRPVPNGATGWHSLVVIVE